LGAEHERATTLGGDAVRALAHLELEDGRRLLDAMLEELLTTVDLTEPADRGRVREAVAALDEHISKELVGGPSG
jgi:hypothetical protein